MNNRLWDPCVTHSGKEAEDFSRAFFAEAHRRVLLLAGAGFDRRTTHTTSVLAPVLGSRVRAVFLKEKRGTSHAEVSGSATSNTSHLVTLVSNSRLAEFPVFSDDNATVGGKRVLEAIRDENLLDVTDLVVDLSGLSVGMSFPLVAHALNLARKAKKNLHVFVSDDPELDDAVVATLAEKAEPVAGFRGDLGLDERSGASLLWLPQLTPRHRKALQRVHQMLSEQSKDHEIDVCPVLPFPSRDPRRGDRLIHAYREEFESAWGVDARDLVYVDERNPVDIYRTVLDIDDVRKRVFASLGGSTTVLTPFGSKVQSLGALMAALDRRFPVVYVETVSYQGIGTSTAQADLVHVWLYGEAYGQEVAKPEVHA